MQSFTDTIDTIITTVSDFVCGYPLFVLLIGGGLFFLIYSGFAPLKYYGRAIKLLGKDDKSDGADGQISSFEALMSTIAATVGMGNIAGVAIALTMGGPGAIFWMWVSAVVGMATKFFEGASAIMYRGKDSAGETQGGTMYMITEGLGKKWKPMAVFFSVMGLIGTLSIMQANQLTEAIMTMFTTPESIENSAVLSTVGATFGWSNVLSFRFLSGVIICLIVTMVVIGGIKRIAKISAKMVPLMVVMYFLIVLYIILTNIHVVPSVFESIFEGAFNLKAGLGGLAGVAIIGARRAIQINEAGVGTASMMHGASKTTNPVREGLNAMIGPSIDSGFLCTLTALAILIKGDYNVEGVKGLEIVLKAFQAGIPGVGGYLFMVVILFFAFSTMFSYSYYGQKCTNYLFGAHNAKWYNYFYLLMIVVAAMIPLHAAVGIIDLAYALMAVPTMITLFILAPRVKKAMREYFSK
ncbi:MAG: alanine/glycine:cation symporter family protein [Flavobacteriales bacterium]|nr:alanine/glycine:cation symporter family protein [Flavobacteriales bacterium]